MIDREVKEVKEDVDLEMVSKYKTIQIPRLASIMACCGKERRARANRG